MNRAADLLVESLRSLGVERLFCVPGESFLAFLDAVRDTAIEVVTCRHEAGAGLMALADAKLTGLPGTVFVSRGPGACNASIALHSAQQDANPLVLFVGQVERKDRYRGAFQEVDYVKTFSDIAKWVVEIDDADRISDLTVTAYHIARSGTPGPVVVVLPEDMLSDATEAVACAARLFHPPHASAADVATVVDRLAASERPLIIAGGNTRDPAARAALLAASEAHGLPVAVTNKHQDVFPNRHPHWAGHLGYAAPKALLAVLREADLVLAVGTRLGDVPTQGYTFPRAPEPEQVLIHVYPDPQQIGRVFAPAEGVVSDAAAFLEALAGVPSRGPARATWVARVNAVAAGLLDWSPREAADGIDFGHAVHAVARHLPRDGIVTIDSGNFVSWVHRYFPFVPTQTLLGAVSGAMGLGVPAAVAAALRHPDRMVVCFVGDGGVLMTGNEIATAVRYRARMTVVIANNGSYGTIRTHQELAFPERVAATSLTNPDFLRWAEAFGARGYRLDRGGDADGVIAAALHGDGVSVVDVRASLENISANATITALRQRP